MAYRQEDGADMAQSSYRGTNGMPRQGKSNHTLHVGVTEGDVAARIITCGTVERARTVASNFDGQVIEREISSARGFLTLTGKFKGEPVSVIATGMGVAMMDFMVREVVAVLPEPKGHDARALIVRFGTCGSINKDVPEGSVVVCSKGSTKIRREPDAFGPSGLKPAVKPYHICNIVPADADLCSHLISELHGHVAEEVRVVGGLNVSCCSFYSSQGRRDPLFDDRHEECDPIASLLDAHPDASSMEMETFTLLDLARCVRPHENGVRAAAASIVVAHRVTGHVASSIQIEKLEQQGGRAVLAALVATSLSCSAIAAPPRPLSGRPSVVAVEYSQLVGGVDLSAAVGQAFGYDGLGLIVVRGVPGVVRRREALLPLAAELAALPEPNRLAYERAESFYAVGWSHGKERLEGKVDTAKGSFYANPLVDAPFGTTPSAEEMRSHPSYVCPNVWPTHELPSLEGAFKSLGQLVVDVGTLVGEQCDALVMSQLDPTARASYPANRLRSIVSDSRCCKARLLHYYPLSAADGSERQVDDVSDWCGWHNDHGALTGLVSGMYLDSRDGKRVSPSPDPAAGLYIRDRHGELHHIVFGDHELGFQIGEAAQILSGGVLQATPHAVRACAPTSAQSRHVSRESFAVFMQPFWAEPMRVPAGIDPQLAQAQSAIAVLPPRVPPLASRWDNTMTFGHFTLQSALPCEDAHLLAGG